MTPSEWYAKHGDNLTKSVADLRTVDEQDFITAAGDNSSGTVLVNWISLSRRLLTARTRVEATR